MPEPSDFFIEREGEALDVVWSVLGVIPMFPLIPGYSPQLLDEAGCPSAAGAARAKAFKMSFLDFW